MGLRATHEKMYSSVCSRRFLGDNLRTNQFQNFSQLLNIIERQVYLNFQQIQNVAFELGHFEHFHSPFSPLRGGYR